MIHFNLFDSLLLVLRTWSLAGSYQLIGSPLGEEIAAVECEACYARTASSEHHREITITELNDARWAMCIANNCNENCHTQSHPDLAGHIQNGRARGKPLRRKSSDRRARNTRQAQANANASKKKSDKKLAQIMRGRTELPNPPRTAERETQRSGYGNCSLAYSSTELASRQSHRCGHERSRRKLQT